MEEAEPEEALQLKARWGLAMRLLAALERKGPFLQRLLPGLEVQAPFELEAHGIHSRPISRLPWGIYP